MHSWCFAIFSIVFMHTVNAHSFAFESSSTCIAIGVKALPDIQPETVVTLACVGAQEAGTEAMTSEEEAEEEGMTSDEEGIDIPIEDMTGSKRASFLQAQLVEHPNLTLTAALG